MLGAVMIVLLPVLRWVLQWENSDNRSTFVKDMDTSSRCVFNVLTQHSEFVAQVW